MAGRKLYGGWAIGRGNASGWSLGCCVVAVIACLALPLASPARADCLDSGAGTLYRGSWYSLSAAERSARCQEAERRAQERSDQRIERDTSREQRRERPERPDRPNPAAREQECLVNAAACDVLPSK